MLKERVNGRPIVILAVLIGVCFLLSVAPLTTPVAVQHELVPSPYNPDMDKLERLALDQIFQKHMMNLFDVWMREPSPEVGRPIAGADKLRKFYNAVRTELDRREKERKVP